MGIFDRYVTIYEGMDELTARHASPFNFDQFDTKHIGKGLGTQVWGWGLYFTTSKVVHNGYMKSFDDRGDNGEWIEGTAYTRRGSIEYTVEIPDDNGHNYLDATSHKTLPVLDKYIQRYEPTWDSGQEFIEQYRTLAEFTSPKKVSLLLSKLGFVGIKTTPYSIYTSNIKLSDKYKKGHPNYVIFDKNNIKVLDKKVGRQELKFDEHGVAIIGYLYNPNGIILKGGDGGIKNIVPYIKKMGAKGYSYDNGILRVYPQEGASVSNVIVNGDLAVKGPIKNWPSMVYRLENNPGCYTLSYSKPDGDNTKYFFNIVGADGSMAFNKPIPGFGYSSNIVDYRTPYDEYFSTNVIKDGKLMFDLKQYKVTSIYGHKDIVIVTKKSNRMCNLLRCDTFEMLFKFPVTGITYIGADGAFTANTQTMVIDEDGMVNIEDVTLPCILKNNKVYHAKSKMEINNYYEKYLKKKSLNSYIQGQVQQHMAQRQEEPQQQVVQQPVQNDSIHETKRNGR